jgi:hypothetical protein
MTRLQALEAVVAALRQINAFHPALAALDALPADPARGEVVKVALFGTARGERCLADPSSVFAGKLIMDGWTRLDTVTLEVTP